MKTIYEARELVNNNLGNKVWIKVNGLRNKNEFVEGIISDCYKNIFIVESLRGIKSFSYSDVLIGTIKLKFK
ncbi:MAG: Veg family protein [Candidatus Coprovivens sp.]